MQPTSSEDCCSELVSYFLKQMEAIGIKEQFYEGGDSNGMENETSDSDQQSSSEDSDVLEEDEDLDEHINRLTTEVIVDIAEKSGATVDSDTAETLKTVVMNRLRHVLMVAIQFSHHDNSPGLSARDFERAEEAVVDPSGRRKEYSTNRDGEEVIDLLKTVSDNKFTDIPVTNLNPQFKIHCPNHFRYFQTESDEECEVCFTSDAGQFKKNNECGITEDDLNCLSSEDEVLYDGNESNDPDKNDDSNSSEQDDADEIGDGDDISPIDDETVLQLYSDSKNVQYLEAQAEEIIQYDINQGDVECDSIVHDDAGILIQTTEELQDNCIVDTIALENNGIDIKEEKYSIEEHPEDTFTEQLIATDLTDGASSTNRYLVHEYVDADGNSYLVAHDSDIANSEGYLSEPIVAANDLQEQKVFEYPEEGMNVDNQDDYCDAITVEEVPTVNPEEMANEEDVHAELEQQPNTNDLLTDDIDNVDEEGFVDEIELGSSDDEVEVLYSEDEIELENSDLEIDLKYPEEIQSDDNSDANSLCSEEEVHLENAEEIEWTKSEEEVEVIITDDKYVCESEVAELTGIADTSASLEESEPITEIINEIYSNEDLQVENSDGYTSYSDSCDDDEKSPNEDELIEYVPVDVIIIDESGENETNNDNLDDHEYRDNEVIFEDSIIQTFNESSGIKISDENIETDTFATSLEEGLHEENQIDCHRIILQGNNDIEDEGEEIDELQDSDQSENSEFEGNNAVSEFDTVTYDCEDDQNDQWEDIEETNIMGRVKVRDIPEIDVEFDYNKDQSAEYISDLNTELEFPVTEIDLVGCDGEAEFSDSDSYTVLSEDDSSWESDDLENSSADSENEPEDGDSNEEDLDSQIENEFLDEYSDENFEVDDELNEHTQIQDCVVFENSSEAIEYQMDYETLKLDNVEVIEQPVVSSSPTEEVENEEVQNEEKSTELPATGTTPLEKTSPTTNCDSTEHSSLPVRAATKAENPCINPINIYNDSDNIVTSDASLFPLLSKLSDVYIIEFEDIDETLGFSENDIIEEPVMCFSIDEPNNTISLEINEPIDILQCECPAVTAIVSETNDKITVAEINDEAELSPKHCDTEELTNQYAANISTTSSDESDKTFENRDNSGEIKASATIVPVNIVNEMYEDEVYTEVDDETGSESDSDDTEIDDDVEDENTDIEQMAESEFLDAGAVEHLADDGSSLTEWNQADVDEIESENCDISDEETAFTQIFCDEGSEESDNSEMGDQLEDMLKGISSNDDLRLVTITSDCLEVSSSSEESDDYTIEKDFSLVSKIQAAKSVQDVNMPSDYVVLPVEWKDYMKMFVSNFFRNINVMNGEVDTEEFCVILGDIRKHGAFPVLDIICDFFLDFIYKKNNFLDCGKALTEGMEIGLGMVSATIKAVLDCPLECSQIHLKLISSVLIDLLTLPTPCRNQQRIIQLFLKVIVKYKELLDWSKVYITETLKRTVKIPLANLTEDCKSLLGGAIGLVNGLETIGIHISQKRSWHCYLLIFSKKYFLLNCRPDVKSFSENDSHIEESIFHFFKTLCERYTGLNAVEAHRLQLILREIYGERMSTYMNITNQSMLPNVERIRRPLYYSEEPKKCNVCFKSDKSNTNSPFVSRYQKRNVKKNTSGNILSLSVML